MFDSSIRFVILLIHYMLTTSTSVNILFPMFILCSVFNKMCMFSFGLLSLLYIK